MPSLIPTISEVDRLAQVEQLAAIGADGANKRKKPKSKKKAEPKAEAKKLDLRLVPRVSDGRCLCRPLQIIPRLTDEQQIYRLRASDSIHLVTSGDNRAALKRVIDGIVLDISRPRCLSPNNFSRVSKVSIWTYADPYSREYAYEVAQQIYRSEDCRAKIKLYTADFAGEDPISSRRLIWSSTWDGSVNRESKSLGDTFKLDPFKEPRSPQPITWVWDGILPRGGTVIVGGAPGAGKSVTTLGLASRIVNGEPFAGRSTAKGRVIYIAFEGMEDAMLTQLQAMGGDRVTLIHSPGPQTAEEGIAEIFKLAVTMSPSLIIVDILQKLLNGINLSSGLEYERTSDAMGRLSSIAQYTDTSFAFLHHAGSTGELLGNKALSGSVDAVLLLSPQHALRSVKQRIGEPLDSVKLRYDRQSYRFVDDGPSRTADKRQELLAALALGRRSNADLRKEFPKWSGKTFNSVMTPLIAEGKVLEIPGATKAETSYVVRDFEPIHLLDSDLDNESLDIGLDTYIPICPELAQA